MTQKRLAQALEWKASADDLAAAKAREAKLRAQLVVDCFADLKVGMNTMELPKGYVLKVEGKRNYKLDPEKTRVAEAALKKMGEVGQLLAARLFKWTPEIRVGEFKELTGEQASLILPALTISPATPSVSLVEPT